MRIFSSPKQWMISFILTGLLIAFLFWLYLNVVASMRVSARQADIQLPHSLPVRINVANHLQATSLGQVDTQLTVDKKLLLPLKGKYRAKLGFEVEVPVSVQIDYQTTIHINQNMPLKTTTDLIYQNRLLPEFPLNLDIPVRLDVPFELKKTYQVPIRIAFDGPVDLEFDESVSLTVLHKFAPRLNLNDPVSMQNIAGFNAVMTNDVRDTVAALEMKMALPVRNIHP